MKLQHILILLQEYSKKHYNDIYMSINIDMYEYGQVRSTDKLIFTFSSVDELIQKLSK